MTVRQALSQARQDVQGRDYIPGGLRYDLDGHETLEVWNKGSGEGNWLLGVYEGRHYNARDELVKRYDV